MAHGGPAEGRHLLVALTRKYLKEEDSPAVVNYLGTILNSNLGGPLLHDDLHQLKIMSSALVRSKRVQDAVRLDELYGKLVKKHTFKKRAESLLFLWALADLNTSSEAAAPNPVFLTEALPRVASSGSVKTAARPSVLNDLVASKVQRPLADTSVGQARKYGMLQSVRKDDEILEAMLLRDLIFVLQGINGKYIKFSSDDEVLVDQSANVSLAVRELIEGRLGEAGTIFRSLKRLVDAKLADSTEGLVARSFYGALSQLLKEFYRLLALLEDQLGHTEEGDVQVGGLTLRRLMVWIQEPLYRLQILSALTRECQGQKGGQLLDRVSAFSHYGDPAIKSMVNNILEQASQPLFATMQQWMYEGTLTDPYGEFFVRANLNVADSSECMWTEKYTLNEAMLPVIIPVDLANKVLVTGKSLHFIHCVGVDCHHVVDPNIRQQHSTEFVYGNSTGLAKAVNHAYLVTSQRLLDLLRSHCHFDVHLNAIRRYMLLGQGEFIQTLIVLLQNDLRKPAKSLYLHNLASHLDTAIRSTNAQFEESYVLKSLDVRLLESTPNELGWNIFSLEYKVPYPLDAIFTKPVRLAYLRLFNFLWRLKLLEHDLTATWQLNVNHSNTSAALPEMAHVLHKGHLLRCAMLHFVNQMLYFLMFEVLECSWATLQAHLAKDRDLDELIYSHNNFLEEIQRKSLLDDSNKIMVLEVRQIAGAIRKFTKASALLYDATDAELAEQQRLQAQATARSQQGGWGWTTADDAQEKERKQYFYINVVCKAQTQIEHMQQMWQTLSRSFISRLSQEKDLGLRLLASRLNLNEYY